MANNLVGLDDFHINDLINEPPWALFEMDLMDDGDETLERNLTSHQAVIPSTTSDTVAGDTLSCGGTLGKNVEWRRSDGNAPLDMNDPTVLSEYGSLFLFVNNPSVHHLDLENYDSSKQAIIRALAAKFSLQYSYDASLGVIQLRKESYAEGLSQHEQQPKTTPRLIPPISTEGSTSCPQWKPSHADRRQNDDLPCVDGTFPLFNSDVAMDVDTTSSEFNFGKLDSWGEAREYSLTTPQYQTLSEDEQDQASSRPAPTQQPRSPWVGLSRTLKEVGACWRCKILRKKCGPDQPCKACPRPGTNTSRWQNIGCKRGTLFDHTLRVSLCPKASPPNEAGIDGAFDALQRVSSSGLYRIKLCLQNAAGRLDNVFASGNDTYAKIVLEILCSSMSVTSNTPLSQRRDVEGNVVHIAWGLVEVSSAKDILNIKSVENTLDIIKAAVTYETEYGLSQAIPLAIECLRNCIDMLRLQDGGHLISELHDDCTAGICQVETFQDLSSNVKSYTDELSKVIFRKENRLQEKRWWLSVFYSLWIQSHVRQTIRFVETQSETPLHPEMKNACSNYLLLALDLFDATSTSFDPLSSTWSLEEEPPNMDLRLIKYYRLAQKTLSELWRFDIGGSIDFLRSLYYDMDTSLIGNPRTDLPFSPIMGIANDNLEGRSLFSPGMFSQSQKLHENKISVPVRTRSGAKRRAGSPLQETGFIRRNGSSSSMLDSRDVRSRGISIASPGSPMSPAYSFAYGTSSSTRWNGSGDSLAEMAKFGTSPPNPRDQLDYLSPSKTHIPSLHYKSSTESFLELPRTLNKRRPTRNTSKSGPQCMFICECCPKKPKRFETMEELSAHEAEKQYQCSFCGNRFKSKNEAERHQNSLHVRRHAWSCLRLRYTDIFQESINQPSIADTCGYCGEDFPRSGGGTAGMQATEQDWEDRLNHATEVHKFNECNSSKKFYRADHFRQHLKHSHAATGGRWINALESVCMTDIPAPNGSGEGS
ncbi:uncharacterized protein F4807DRAFT_102051 [Annulohypoxylon truncatum]|uniref:uncharacterized protein n=1 Tax=Annulohypoxylon truncatum TaxID=327061 RepID=UPI002008E8B1|nr:uncharacterized protein F4807DRAFT_102051 [Annulohypoxylon truncatum]KAI1209263.1 hypothetical protein F4807DRAFT_102051 [Annulohypoxylon truncatum]